MGRFATNPACVTFLTDFRLGAMARVTTLKQGQVLWRAQVGSTTKRTRFPSSASGAAGHIELDLPAPFDAARMIPNEKLVGSNRLNPRGIAYLYLAGDAETAIAEVRPWLGASVSVAQFELLRDCSVVDCSTPSARLPFGLKLSADGRLVEPPESEWDAIVWGNISHAFAEPTDPHDSEVAYAPTQILAEVLYGEGYDGVVYQSAMLSEGKNVALLDVSSARLFACELRTVGSIAYSSTSQGPGYSLPRETKTPAASAIGPTASGV